MYSDFRMYELPEFVRMQISQHQPIKIERVRESANSPVKTGITTYVLTMANGSILTIHYDATGKYASHWG